jgi:hypothetical protein
MPKIVGTIDFMLEHTLRYSIAAERKRKDLVSQASSAARGLFLGN